MKRITVLFIAAAMLICSLFSCAVKKSDAPEITESESGYYPPDLPDIPFPPDTLPSHKEEYNDFISFTVPREKNRNMCESLNGVIEGNTITLTITAPTDTYSLKNAAVEYETSGGEVYFPIGENGKVDLTNENCFCVVKDAKGEKRFYKIKLEYGENLIPVISIDVKSGKPITSKEEYVDATVSIDVNGVNGWYLPSGFESLEPTEVGIKGRGNSTWDWEKKPYKLKFDSKTEVLGMKAAKKWILLANYSDYSLMRNYVAMEASKVLGVGISPLSQYPVNLFINGEYAGVYSIGEDHEVKDGRIDLPKDDGKADTSFLLEIGGYESDDIYGVTIIHTDLIRHCSIEYPESEDLTPEQFKLIEDYIKKANSAVKSLKGYEEYIDVDSLIDWFISTELFYNLESCFRRSCYITKQSGGKLTMGPIWDYDLAMGNLYNDYGKYTSWACLMQEKGYIEDNWFCYLMNDPSFRAKLKTRWNKIKNELLEKTLYCIDEMEKTLSPSAEYNFKLWKILGTRAVKPQPLAVKSQKTYAQSVEYIRDFVIDRWNWMDKNI